MRTPGFDELSVVREQMEVNTRKGGQVEMVGLNVDVMDLDAAKPLVDLYVQAGRQIADAGSLDRGLVAQIEGMRTELIADGSGDAVNRAMHVAETLLEAEGIDWATGTRKTTTLN